jgi:hypothetical protein
LAETTVFLSYFKDMPDHRQAGKVTYPLDEILLLCLLAVLAGAERLPTSPALAKRSSTSCAAARPWRARSASRPFCPMCVPHDDRNGCANGIRSQGGA